MTPESIISATAEVNDITVGDLTGPRRFGGLVTARIEAGVLLRKCTSLSLAHIGWKMGRRDQTTVRHWLKNNHRAKPDKLGEIIAIASRPRCPECGK